MSTPPAHPSTSAAREAAVADPGLPAPSTRTARGVPLAAVALVGAAALLRGWTLYRGYFYIDDFAFMARATEHPLVDPGFLTQPYNSHLMPGSYVWVWLTTRAFPLGWGPVATAVLGLQLLLSYLVYRLLTELFGRRPAVLVPLAVAVLSPVALPALLWWAAALNQLPQQLAVAATLLLLTRYLRTGRRLLALAGPAVFATGLLFSERTLLALPLLVAVTLVFFTSGSVWSRVAETARRHRVLWTGYAVVTVPYLTYYLLSVPSPLRAAPTGHDVADLVSESVFRATVPGLLGGPWTWMKVGFAGGLADPDGLAAFVALLVFAAVVSATVTWWRGAAAAWLLLLGYAAVNLAILAGSRATVIGPVIGTEYRYQTDLALVGAVALGLATMPVVGRFALADPQRLRPRVAARAWVDSRVLEPLRDVGLVPARPDAPTEAVAAGAAVIALAVSSGVSSLQYDRLWVENPARAWVDTVTGELEDLPAGTVLADTPVPEQVAWGFIAPYNASHRVLAPVLDDTQRLRSGHAAQAIVVPDADGHLRPAAVAGVQARPGPVDGCGWALEGGPVTIPLDATAPDARPVIRIGYLASAATELTVRVNGSGTVVPVAPGLGTAYLVATGPLSEVVVVARAAGARVCPDDVTVGAPLAVAAAPP